MTKIEIIVVKTLVVLSLVWMEIESQLTTAWTQRPELRMGQTSIFDAVYIPLGVTSTMDVAYKTAFTDPLTVGSQTPHRGLVLSGFQNYLHYQINVRASITTVLTDRITVSVTVGATTYIKQLNINYFVMIPVAVGKYLFVEVLSKGYTPAPALSGTTTDPLVPRTDTLPETTTKNPAFICSAIQGIDYINTDGIVNQVNLNSKFSGTSITYDISVGEKGKLNYITITTIVIDKGYYPVPDTYVTLGQVLTSTVKNDGPPKSGFDQLDFMNLGGLFTKDNTFFFGMRGFKFKMEQTRMFLLTIATTTQLMSVSNLEASSWEYVDLSMMVMVDKACTLVPGSDHYFMERFNCVASTVCTTVTATAPYTTSNLLVDSTNSVCLSCAAVCDNCLANDPLNCDKCMPGSNRVPLNPTPPLPLTAPTCQCVTGYIEVDGGAICQKCSDLIPGCTECSSPQICTTCNSATTLDPLPIAGVTVSSRKCVCPLNKYLVTGLCLSYSGCLVANIYITGEFCEVCDTANNFEKLLANNSKCDCKLAYNNKTNPYRCEDICADGQTPESPANASETEIICDDNNTQSGDGCSSTCRQQFGYKCTVQKIGGISTCSEKQQIKITYLYSEKNLIGNQGVIVFALLPAQHSLAQNTFENSISMNLPGSKKIKFDPVNSLIMITVDYPSTLESNEYEFNFTFAGLITLYSPDIYVKAALRGINAKLETSQSPQMINIITYVAMGVSAFALALALISSFLGEKLLGIELILPVQAAFFSMATLPNEVLSPISALWSLKFSSGYNSLEKYNLATNYMLDNRITMMQYSGQYILNYNIMFLLLALVILIIGIIALRIAWLERQEKRIQEIQKKKQDEDKNEPKEKTKDKTDKEDDKETEDQSKKDDEINMENLEEELEDTRENIKNWRNFLHMIFDRFFSILIITAMMKVIFCFYIQLSNLTYTAEVYDNSLNAGFFFLTYAVIVTGLYTIIYDYKTDKLILFTCNKGKYAMLYITIFLAFIIVLGAVFETMIVVYASAVFAIMPIVLIIYQVPYGLRMFDFQAIIAIICQLPFGAMVAISLFLNLQKDTVTESTSLIFAYAIIGSIGLSIILTIIRLIKVIDCKKVSCVQFTDRKKENSNDKNKKKNKVALLEIDMDKDWDEEGSVRAVLFDRSKNQENQDSHQDHQSQDHPRPDSQNIDHKVKDKQKPHADEEDDQDIDELEKIKMKLRKDLKQKKATGKVK